MGSKYTKNRLPIELVYLEEYSRIDEAFYREKQVQGWTRKKKEALMRNQWKSLHELAMCQNASTSLSINASGTPSINTSNTTGICDSDTPSIDASASINNQQEES